jgi:uncharacterized membrane protein
LEDVSSVIFYIGLSVLISSIILITLDLILSSRELLILVIILGLISIVDSLIPGSSNFRFEKLAGLLRLLSNASKADKTMWSVVVAFLLVSSSLTVYFLRLISMTNLLPSCCNISTSGNASDYHNNISLASNYSLVIGVNNHEGRAINYNILCFMVDVKSINHTSIIPQQMIFLGSKTCFLVSDPPAIDSNWEAQWESEWSFSFNQTGQYKLFFFLFLGEPPEYLNELNVGTDYKNKEASMLLDDYMHSEVLNVNLNINIY